MRRLLALLVAAGLIAGAVVVRNAIEADDGPDRGGRRDQRLTCAHEVEAACDGLRDRYDVTIEDVAATAERLASTPGDDVELDLWIAPDPWPAMVDDIRARNGFPKLFQATVTPIARSPLVALVPDSVGTCDWQCLSSGERQVGARSLSSGIGLLQLGAAAAARVGRADFATNDLSLDSGFPTWLAAFVGSVVESDEPVTRLLQSRAFFPIALTFEADALAALDAAAESRKAGLTLLYPAPMASVDIVVADTSPGGDGAADLVPAMTQALVAAGWKPVDGPNGLPRAGVLVALRGMIR